MSSFYQNRKSKYVSSDGVFKVNEKILYRNSDRYNDGIKYKKAVIKDIETDGNGHYRYQISVRNNYFDVDLFWVERNSINKKNIVKSLIDETLLPFKIGDEVYSVYFMADHQKVIIKDIEISSYNRVRYTIETKDGRKFNVGEYALFLKKTHIERSIFEKGDKITYVKNYFKRDNATSFIKNFFIYDDNINTVYCELENGSILEERLIKKYKEPIVVFSEEDPYGEEDWGE